MAKWMNMNLNGGKTPSGEPIVNQSIFQDIHTPSIYAESPIIIKMTKPTFPIEDTAPSYSFGWFSGIYRGMRITSAPIT